MLTTIRSRLALVIIISIILLFLSGLGTRTLLTEQVSTAARPEITFQIRQYPEDRDPWNRGFAIRIRLDIDRLRAYDLSGEDVMQACTESSVLGSSGRVDPPPGVVFVKRLLRPEQYENLIVKASAEGDIVRLKDVARLEVAWSMFDIAH